MNKPQMKHADLIAFIAASILFAVAPSALLPRPVMLLLGLSIMSLAPGYALMDSLLSAGFSLAPLGLFSGAFLVSVCITPMLALLLYSTPIGYTYDRWRLAMSIVTCAIAIVAILMRWRRQAYHPSALSSLSMFAERHWIRTLLWVATAGLLILAAFAFSVGVTASARHTAFWVSDVRNSGDQTSIELHVQNLEGRQVRYQILRRRTRGVADVLRSFVLPSTEERTVTIRLKHHPAATHRVIRLYLEPVGIPAHRQYVRFRASDFTGT